MTDALHVTCEAFNRNMFRGFDYYLENLNLYNISSGQNYFRSDAVQAEIFKLDNRIFFSLLFHFHLQH